MTFSISTISTTTVFASKLKKGDDTSELQALLKVVVMVIVVVVAMAVIAALKGLVAITALVVVVVEILSRMYPPGSHYYPLLSNHRNLFVQIPENLKCSFHWSLSILISI
jgi:hypothetical protein